MKKITQLALRYMKKNKGRTLTTWVGVMLSAMLIYLIFATGFSISEGRGKEGYEHDLGYDAYFKCNYEIALTIREETENIDSSWLVFYDTDTNVMYVDDINKIPVKLPVKSGNVPQNENEVLVNKAFGNDVESSVGDKVRLLDQNTRLYEKDEYAVSGIIEDDSINLYPINSSETEIMSVDYISILGEKINKKLKDRQDIVVFVNVSFLDKSHIGDDVVKLAEKYGCDTYVISEYADKVFNKSGTYKSFEDETFLLLIAFIAAIGTMVLIRNAFNISVNERLSDYGMLRCIGMTRKQIIKMIIYEGLLIAIAGTLVGIIIGHGLLYIGFSIAREYYGVSKWMTVNLYPVVIILTFIYIVGFTFYAMYGPMEKVYKLNPINALSQKEISSFKTVKAKTGKKIEKVFGVIASYSWKNVMRHKGRFLLCTVTLSVATMIFVSVGCTYISFNNIMMDDISKSGYTDAFYVSDVSSGKDVVKHLEKMKCVDKVLFHTLFVAWDTDETKEEKEWFLGVAEDKYNEFLNAVSKKDDIQEQNCSFIKELSEYESGECELLLDYDGQKKDITVLPSRAVSDSVMNKFFEEIDLSKTFANVYIYRIENEDIKKAAESWKYNNLINMTDLAFTISVRLDFKENLDEFDDYVDNSGYYHYAYMDYKTTIEEIKNSMMFVYPVLVLMLVVYILNIVNLHSSDMMLRRKELQILNIIGMSKKQQKKMIFLESTFQSVIALFIGNVLGAVTGFGITSIMAWERIPFYISWKSVIGSIAVMFLVNFFIVVFGYRDKSCN